jgi:hypothetical protein
MEEWNTDCETQEDATDSDGQSRNRAIQSAEADPCETSTDVEADHREQVKVGDDTEEEPQQGDHRDIYRHICINVLIFDERLRRIDSVGRGC